MSKPNGYTIYSDRSRVIIATGLGGKRSQNRKTGDMVQIWILARGVDPVVAVKTGRDSIICGDCPHRGTKGSGRSCYVNVGQAPLGIWRAWQRGAYPKLKFSEYGIFEGRAVRFGAYGDRSGAHPTRDFQSNREARLEVGRVHASMANR